MGPTERTTLADLLGRQMDLLGFTQKAVAAGVGVSQQTVSKWLAGETRPRVTVVPALADLLALDPMDLWATVVIDVAPAPRRPADDLRVAAFDRMIRDLTPAQMDQLEAYLRGLRDGAAGG